MKFDSNHVTFGPTIPLDDFAGLAAHHHARVRGTRELEAVGQLLAANAFPEEEVADFVRRVCRWGGYSGIWGRILKQNEVSAVRDALMDAVDHLTTGGTADALRSVNRLKGLGAPSFASKHLRLLAPDRCPVFDTILRDALPYAFSPEGYAAWANDCGELAAILTERSTRNPRREPESRWLVADAEAVVFEWVWTGSRSLD